MIANFSLDENWLDFQQVKQLISFSPQLSISPSAIDKINHCREFLDKKIEETKKRATEINHLKKRNEDKMSQKFE